MTRKIKGTIAIGIGISSLLSLPVCLIFSGNNEARGIGLFILSVYSLIVGALLITWGGDQL